VKHRHCLLGMVVTLCVAATANAQYVEDSIDVDGREVGSLVYNSRMDVVYGTAFYRGFFALSCDSNRLIKSFPMYRPFFVVYDSIDNKAYCTQDSINSLVVVDGVTHTRVGSLPVHGGATIPVWDPVSDRLYVSCQDANEVAVMDCVTDFVLEYISVGACPIQMYTNTPRRKLYVLNCDDGTVSIVNMATNQVVKTVVTGGATVGYFSAGADKLYCDGSGDTCVVIGGQSDTVVARIPLAGLGTVMSASGNEGAGLVYLGTYTGSADHVVALSAHDDTVLATAVIGREPRSIACVDQSGLVYCASSRSDEVYVVSGDGARVLGRLQVGDYPFVFAAAPRHRRLYLGHLGSAYVYVLRDTVTGGIAELQLPHPGSRGICVSMNPFSHSVAVSWNSAPRGDDVTRVYAQDGRMVRQGRIAAGEARWVWDGRDDSGAPLPPGVYVIEVGPGLRAKVVKLK
jgi:YVTN family beta-propeller protein